jgi:hypothetical protein
MATAEVPLSVSHGQTIAYSANGLLLKQKEVVEVTEVRGYTNAASAKAAAAAAFSDTSKIINLFHTTQGGGFVMASVLSGNITTAVASRANEANMWRVVKTKSTYTHVAPVGGEWSTTRPSAGYGNIVSISNSQRIVTQVEGYTLFAEEVTSTREYRGCTAAEADNLLRNRPADTLVNAVFVCKKIATEIGRVTTQVGKRYTVDSRYVSDTEGLNVSVHETTITVSGTSWSRLS